MSTRVAQLRTGALGARVIVVCALVLVASSLLKFWQPGPIVTYLGSMGYEGADVYLIAVIELATALLLLFPRTRAFGLFMASAYLGGAVAAHVAIHRYTSNDPFIAFMAMHTHIGTLEPGVLLAVLWFGSWFSQRPAQAFSSTPAHATLRHATSQQSA